MAMEITSSYGSYAAQGLAGDCVTGSAKKKETAKAQETAGSDKSKSMSEYANELAKLVPSVEFKVGNSFSTVKSGKTLTVNPQLLEKMRNDPEKEREMKELIRGVEAAVNTFDSILNASGWSVVFKHSYIDENGKYRQISLVRNDFMLNMSDELREERRKNSEKLIEKMKEKAVQKKEESEEILEEKAEIEKSDTEESETDKSETGMTETGKSGEGNTDGELVQNKVEQFLNEKMAVSKDGTVYLNDTDIRTILEAVKEDNAGRTKTKQREGVGAYLDLQV